MKRISIAASKINPKGNVRLYNLYVVLISCLLFSLFIFIAAGATIALALMLIGYIGTGIMGVELKGLVAGHDGLHDYFDDRHRFVQYFAILINVRVSGKFLTRSLDKKGRNKRGSPGYKGIFEGSER